MTTNLLPVFCAIGLPPAVQEYRFAAPQRQWRFDYSWPDRLVALEIEGGAYIRGRHTRGRGYENDIEKYNEAARRGWRVFRCTTGQLKKGAIFNLLREVLA